MNLTTRHDFRNVLVLIVAQAFSAGVGLIAFFRIGTLFTVTELGRFGFASSLTVLFGLMAELGVRYVAIKAIAIDPSCSRNILKHSIVVRLVLSVFSLALLCGMAHYYPPWRSETRLLFLAGLIAVTQFGADPITWVFFGKGRVDTGGMILILDRMLYVLLINTAAQLWQSAEAIMLASLLANVLRTALGWIWLRPSLDDSPKVPGWNQTLFKRLITEGLEIGIAVILSVAYTGISVVVAQSVTTPQELGFYSIAFGMVSILLVIPMAMTNALFPTLAKANAGEIQPLYHMMSKFTFLIAVPMVGAVFVFGDPLLILWAGGRYESAYEVLRILAVGLFAGACNYLFRIFLFAYNQQNAESLIDLAGIIVFVLCGLVFHNQLNAIRIAYLYSVLEWILLLTKVCVTSRWLGPLPHKTLFVRILATTFITSAVVAQWIDSVKVQALVWPVALYLLMILTKILPRPVMRNANECV